MFKFKKILKNFFLFWVFTTIFIGSYHYWKVNGRYHKPEWYDKYETLELDEKQYAIIGYNKKGDKFLIVEALIQGNELTLNMKKSSLNTLSNIPICYKTFKKVKIIK